MNETLAFLLAACLTFLPNAVRGHNERNPNGDVAGIDLATVPGDDHVHHRIAEAGTYYLSADLEVTRETGIDIAASGVTLDLNGFEIRRVSGSGGHGIFITFEADECVVKNGSVSGFAYGVRAFSERGIYQRLQASNCALAGMVAGDSWLLHECEAFGNERTGILLGENNTIILGSPARTPYQPDRFYGSPPSRGNDTIEL